MSTVVQAILDQIDRLDEAGQEELRAALRLRSYSEWAKLAEVEWQRSAADGIKEEEVQQAVDELRCGGKPRRPH
jgi:hypothetical protein